MAPGLWRCDSIVTYYVTGMFPTPGAPPHLGMMSAQSYPQQRVCGVEYHEATSRGNEPMQYCACGTGAIGRYAQDHKHVCGFHSKMRAAQRLCDQCASQFDARAASNALDRTFDAANGAVAEFRTVVSSLSALASPADRALMLALLAPFRLKLSRSAQAHGVEDRVERAVDKVLMDGAASLLNGQLRQPGCDLSNAPGKWSIDPPQVMAHWRAAGMLTAGTSLQLDVLTWEKGLLGGMKKRTRGSVVGWRIGSGSHGSSGTYGSPGTPASYVLEDGTLGLGPCGGSAVTNPTEPRPVTTQDLRWMMANGHVRIPGYGSDLAGVISRFT